ncbi:MAG: fumarylacetoacetate hydrolase family protein [Emcibacteraceae bacterium]|nr:fumarylacetoacetate hydrolase family protein [Emcibacteraceae bacterium]MDG1858049.1 fumarylacetoacetate hydrolase family protein [Emcibacteraceae bacterium]
MKLASLKHGRDGKLVVVSKDLSKYVDAASVAPTMQAALDEWANCEPKLISLYNDLENGSFSGEAFDPCSCDAPLPRSYHWVDGSAYVTHVELVRKARGAELPPSFWEDPLVYMGASDAFIGPCDDVMAGSEDWGIDLEAEVAIITDDVPAGTKSESALKHIKLISILNDVSLRNLIPAELGKQFGFYQSKPQTAFAPVFVTPDELGDAWHDAKVHLPLHAILNGEKVGSPNAGIDMTFDFARLVEHCAKSRALIAGTVIGSGTVSNKGSHDGSCCLAEVRCLETIADGKPSTPFMSFGDRVEIDMFDEDGNTIFGRINQKVVKF